MNRKVLLQAADWLLPPNLFRLLTYYHPSALRFALTHRDILQANRAYLNRHQGERCFILCNGPSVRQQDILPLKQELVFSVSNGYMHPEYSEICPRYHCVPQLTYGKMTTDLAVKWFREMNERIGHADLFIDAQEWGLVRRHGLFPGRQVNHVCMGMNYFPCKSVLPDLSGIIPRVQTVPIMVIMIALYMGFREIYLLGTDHDWFVKKEYKYFFEPGLLKGVDPGVRPDGTLETTLWDELPAVTKVWSQYRSVKRIAQVFGTSIYNATQGGMLDEFERVRLEDLFPSK